MNIKKNAPLLIILAASLIVHFIYFGHPNETVFDEVHFGKFITGYFTHEYFFDIHPPLGKLLISGVGYITGFKPGFGFAQIGQKFPNNNYIWLRLLPNIAGALLPLIIYFLALRLNLSKPAAFAAGMLIALENSILSQSRIMLLDSFLWLFGFSALLSYFRFKQEKNIKYLYLAGILGALSLSVKWTGATFLVSIIVLEAIPLIKNGKLKISKLAPDLISLVFIPFVIYFIIFAIHLGLLPKTGPGDAFMTQGFQKTLSGNFYSKDQSIKPLNLFEKFVELNTEMYKANATLTAGHPYSSKWYTWPFMARPIYYWYQANATVNSQQPTVNSSASRIYFIGNPIIWWLSTMAVIYVLIALVGRRLKAEFSLPRQNSSFYFLMASLFFNILPFIGIKRAMFLYHYVVAMIFAVLILCYLIDGFKFKKKKKIFKILVLASLISFIYFAPLIYGLPLTEKAYNARVWLPSWK